MSRVSSLIDITMARTRVTPRMETSPAVRDSSGGPGPRGKQLFLTSPGKTNDDDDSELESSDSPGRNQKRGQRGHPEFCPPEKLLHRYIATSLHRYIARYIATCYLHCYILGNNFSIAPFFRTFWILPVSSTTNHDVIVLLQL